MTRSPDSSAQFQEVTPETFPDLRARYRGCLDSATDPDLVYVDDWLVEVGSSGSAENECYRMFGEAFDDDLFRGAKLLAAEWTRRLGPASRNNKVRYMLRFYQRVLFANYAITHAFRMERLLCCAGDGWQNLLWRIFAAYSVPRCDAS